MSVNKNKSRRIAPLSLTLISGLCTRQCDSIKLKGRFGHHWFVDLDSSKPSDTNISEDEVDTEKDVSYWILISFHIQHQCVIFLQGQQLQYNLRFRNQVS